MIGKPLEDQELYRREAMGAFAHEVRTPLTSIRMVLELAKRQSSGGELVLDPELASMLNASIVGLQQLADDLQETSRLERGKLPLGSGPCELDAAVAAAAELVAPTIQIVAGPVPAIAGNWDVPRVIRAIAGFAESANRIGDGSGQVRLTVSRHPGAIRLQFESGTSGGDEKPIAADAGFSFFRSRQFILAMRGSVDWARSERYLRVTVSLPL
ncbi:MAG: HAMP domain-containing histidine kinase [Chloroflexi bacterium]|nr:HAMP domain-containing histidine kinase [Chloroflexota bacterium]